jgi:hypothetical protein
LKLRGELAGGGVALEDGDGVVSAIGNIDDLAIRMGDGLGGAEAGLAAVGFGNGGDGLDFG